MKWLTKMLGKGKKKKAGFTLIELMIVIIIVGILAAIAVPIYSGFVKRARSSEAKATVGGIRTGQLVYHAEHEYYVTTGTDDVEILAKLGIDVTKNRWFDTPDDDLVMILTFTDTGVSLVGAEAPITDIGATIEYETGVLQYTTDGTLWLPGD